MTSSNRRRSSGPPPPVLDLTIEQQFKLRRLKDLLQEASKEDIIIVFEALQHQNFVLSNTVSNLVKQWPTPMTEDQTTTAEDPFKFGTSSETKD